VTLSRLAACAALFAMPCLAELAIVDANGRLAAMLYRGQDARIRTDLVLPSKGWAKTVGLSSAEGLTVSRGDESVFQGRLALDSTQKLQFTQRISEVDGKLRISVTYAAMAELAAEGLYFRVNIPWTEFNSGTAEIGGRTITLPSELPANVNLLYNASASELRAMSPAGDLWWSASMSAALPVNLQDKSNESPKAFTYWIYLHRGALPSSTQGSFTIDLAIDGIPDTTSASLSIEPESSRYLFHGFGGNYAFQIESPVTAYTLEHIHSRWARTEITLVDWEPENENSSTADTDYGRFIANDKPGSRLRHEFELMRTLKQKGIPFVASVWRLPEWMLADRATKRPEDRQRVIDPAMFDELIESLTAYVLYARDFYGVEADLFSFNEPDLGIRILLTPEEHRQAVRRIGSHFASMGISTKMLLGDTSHARGTHTYVLPAAEDPEALQYAGAIAFHSWNGASPEQYQAWAELAERLQLPLLVAELGTDPSGWQGRAYDSYWYGINELQLYQDILTHARPQGTMYWEFTADYSLVRLEGDQIIPTGRFWLTKQLANLTPPMSTALAAASSHGKVSITAFRAGDVYTVHIANISAARDAVLTGLPAEVASWRAVLTTEDSGFQELDPHSPSDGSLSLQLPARSLLTLTNLPAPESEPVEPTP
jgi:O-glycosyl hydrolase